MSNKKNKNKKKNINRGVNTSSNNRLISELNNDRNEENEDKVLPTVTEKKSDDTENSVAEAENETVYERDEDVKIHNPIKLGRKEPLTSDEAESIRNINEALSETDDEINDGINNGEIIEEQETQVKRPNKFYLVFAVFIIIMSIIGVISTVNFCRDFISDIANQTDLKNDIGIFLYPVVSVDPPECKDVTELPSSIIVESALWRIILTGDNSNYEKLYNSYMYVPAVDVEFAIRSMYGNSVIIEHQTVGNSDVGFTYITDSNSYLVPINPRYSAYSPRVTEVSNVGELYTVRVEYIPPSALSIEGIGFESKATKTMVFTLSKNKNNMTLHAIENATDHGVNYEG